MSRCDVHLCGDPITPGETGFVCAVCEKAFCLHHSGPGCMDLNCCEDDQRQCEFCGKVTTANEGIHLGENFKCSACVFRPLGAGEVLPPLVPLFQELENVA